MSRPEIKQPDPVQEVKQPDLNSVLRARKRAGNTNGTLLTGPQGLDSGQANSGATQLLGQ